MLTPCFNSGTCNFNTDGTYFCLCPPNYSGTHCETHDPCLSSPCVNNGNCTATNGEYRCTCEPLSTGQKCESLIACLSSPCLNNGNCTADSDGGYGCSCLPGFPGPDCEAADCQHLYELGNTTNGVYTIHPTGGAPVTVYCDMAKGGWTIISSKTTADWSNKRWADYKVGFGDPADQYYFGNDNIFHLTSQAAYKLDIEFIAWDDSVNTFHAATFSIDNEANKYQLSISGFSSTPSSLIDFVASHNGMKFSTPDSDNDVWSSGSCANWQQGGFWYTSCWDVHPTSNYCSITGSCSAACMGFDLASGGCVNALKAVMRVKRI